MGHASHLRYTQILERNDATLRVESSWWKSRGSFPSDPPTKTDRLMSRSFAKSCHQDLKEAGRPADSVATLTCAAIGTGKMREAGTFGRASGCCACEPGQPRFDGSCFRTSSPSEKGPGLLAGISCRSGLRNCYRPLKETQAGRGHGAEALLESQSLLQENLRKTGPWRNFSLWGERIFFYFSTLQDLQVTLPDLQAPFSRAITQVS